MINTSEIEKRFVESFVRKDRRERLLFELSTQSKRYSGVSRFCHQSGELIDKSKVRMQGENLEFRPEFRSFVKEHDEQCYVMSPDYSVDRSCLFLKDAVEIVAMGTEAAVIVGSSFAVVFGEAVKGGREKYLLVDTVLCL